MLETNTQPGFEKLGLSPSSLKSLKSLGITKPTPIQERAIPVVLEGCDLIGIAQTGTGKTLAFGLPMKELLSEGGETGLVIAPTRELALQIEETFRNIGVSTALLIGGAPMNPQVAQIRRHPQVIVATPGRLEDHVSQRSVDLRHVGIIVLDEADRMLDMGFAPAIRRIIRGVPSDRQTLLFSATMPQEIMKLANEILTDPIRVEIERPGTSSANVSHELVVVAQPDKTKTLSTLLRDHDGTVLVFARTRWGAAKVTRAVRSFGHTAAELHSDRTLSQRQAALNGFKSGQVRVLVATDIAARGIDVKEISLVVNFDLPDNPEDYVHRIGRTGRAGHLGHAITIATPDQSKEVRAIEKLIRKELPRSTRSSEELVGTSVAQQRSRPAGNLRPAKSGNRGNVRFRNR